MLQYQRKGSTNEQKSLAKESEQVDKVDAFVSAQNILISCPLPSESLCEYTANVAQVAIGLHHHKELNFQPRIQGDLYPLLKSQHEINLAHLKGNLSKMWKIQS